MAWSWSHSPEAYRDAELNLRALPVETLREIRAEWMARDDSDYDGFSPAMFADAMRTLSDDAEALADAIWDLASDQQTCDNGGFNAWMCPFGCGPHCVAFDRESAGVS